MVARYILRLKVHKTLRQLTVRITQFLQQRELQYTLSQMIQAFDEKIKNVAEK